MKTKAILYLGIIFLIPMGFTVLINLSVCMDNIAGTGFTSEKFNYPFVFWSELVSIACFLYTVAVLVSMIRRAPEIDRYDKAEQEYLDAKRKLETAAKKFEEMITNQKNKED